MALKKLLKIKDRMTKPEHWCQHIFNNGPAHCLYGWTCEVYKSFIKQEKVAVMIHNHLKVYDGMTPRASIMYWNDSPDRTFQQVRALVTKLNI